MNKSVNILQPKDFAKESFELEFIYTIREDRMDSFFYDGVVVTIKKDDITIDIVAVGEIRITDHNGNMVAGNLWEDDGVMKELDNDKLLEKNVGHGEEDKKYIWQNNNWYELRFVDDDEYIDLHVIYHDLSAAITDVIEEFEHHKKNMKKWNLI